MLGQNITTLKILIIGHSNATNNTSGKSSLLGQFCDNSFSERYVPTMGIDFKIKSDPSNTIKFVFWDASGQERFRTIGLSHYQRVNAFMLCANLDQDKEEFKKNINVFLNNIEQRILPESPIFLIGTKADKLDTEVERANNAANQATLLTIAAENQRIKRRFITSAKEPNNAEHNKCLDTQPYPIPKATPLLTADASPFTAVVESMQAITYDVVIPDAQKIYPTPSRSLDDINDRQILTTAFNDIVQKYPTRRTSFWGSFLYTPKADETPKPKHAVIQALETLGHTQNNTIQGSDILGCLGSKKKKVDKHLRDNTEPTTGTEKTIVEVYNTMMPRR